MASLGIGQLTRESICRFRRRQKTFPRYCWQKHLLSKKKIVVPCNQTILYCTVYCNRYNPRSNFHCRLFHYAVSIFHRKKDNFIQNLCLVCKLWLKNHYWGAGAGVGAASFSFWSQSRIKMYTHHNVLALPKCPFTAMCSPVLHFLSCL
jgi:hypothetical protein